MTAALPIFKQMTIVGVGLIGGSLGMICKQQKLVGTVIGTGRRVENLKQAVALQAIDRYSTDLAEAASGSDLLLLATPVDTFEDVLKTCAPGLARGAIVTDVGSVKGRLVTRMEALVSGDIAVVGAHPIAGKEKSGVAAATIDLFRGSRCILTPTSRTNPAALAKIRRLWAETGAVVTEMDPELHDRVLGAVSHLPHIVAYALVNTIASIQESQTPEVDLQALAGGGYRDTTRIAASSPEMWRDICLWNRDNLVAQIDQYLSCLETFKALIKSGDSEGLFREMDRAKQVRERLKS
ncbi:MAG TPA: prephenate dehydrogenase [Nitrospirales bacterium]|jgi:prephenate dehydrogenase